MAAEGLYRLEGIGGGIQVWDEETLKEKLKDASEGGVYDGKVFIYPLWKTLLNKWFADEDYEGSKIYLVTPFLDEKRMEDVCRMILLNDADDRLEYFYVRKTTDANAQLILGIQAAVLEKIMIHDRSEEMRKRLTNIYGKIVDPGKRFHAKFMCCVRGNQAEIFVTSANFQKYHFDYNNLETVQYITTTRENFEQNFLHPLA